MGRVKVLIVIYVNKVLVKVGDFLNCIFFVF